MFMPDCERIAADHSASVNPSVAPAACSSALSSDQALVMAMLQARLCCPPQMFRRWFVLGRPLRPLDDHEAKARFLYAYSDGGGAGRLSPHPPWRPQRSAAGCCSEAEGAQEADCEEPNE